MKDSKVENKALKPATAGEAEDGLSLEEHRLSQNFQSSGEVKKAIISIPVRKPGKQEFIKVHPEATMSFETHALKVEEDNEFYILKSNLLNEVADHVYPIILFTAINDSGDLFLWPIRLPGPDGKLNRWHQSGLEAASLAKKEWVRLQPKRSLGGYEPQLPQGELPEPQWPDMSFQEIFRIAFKNYLIDDRDHPVLKKLRGEL